MQRNQHPWLPALGLALCASANAKLCGQTPQLIADINRSTPTPEGSYPAHFHAIQVGTATRWVFRAGSKRQGAELWITDGRTAGTVLLKDINPGIGDSLPGAFTLYKGELYFTANDGSTGYELWKTNGTAAGTVLVKDINPGTNAAGQARHSAPSGLAVVQTSPTVATLFFRATTKATGAELWKTNGTTASTVLVKDIHPGVSATGVANDAEPWGLTALGRRLVFRADDGARGAELWSSDGTTAGTTLIRDIRAGVAGSFPWRLTRITTPAGARILFSASLPSSGEEPWLTDGTSLGTVLLQDLNPGAGDARPKGFTPVGTRVYFSATDGTTTGSHGREPWIYDTTASGTTPKCALLKDIHPGTSGSYPADFTADHLGNVYFSASDDRLKTGSGRELWRTGGTAATTVLAKDIHTGTHASGVPYSSYPNDLTHAKPYVYFGATDSPMTIESGGKETAKTGYELYVVLPSGTVQLVKDIAPGPPGSGPASIYNVVGPRIFFAANDAKTGHELWTSTGSASSTVQIANLDPDPTSSTPIALTDINGRLHFDASVAQGVEPFVSDGSASGTKQLKDVHAGTTYGRQNDSEAHSFIDLAGIALFAATDAKNGTELWRSDGTAAGTTLVKDIWPGTWHSSPKNLTLFRNRVYFEAWSPARGAELWRSDGTGAGTVLVKDVHPGSVSGGARDLTPVGDTLYFTVFGTSGVELYKTDGSASGTVLVKDLEPGRANSFPQELCAMGGKVYFSAQTAATGNELFVSDGTSAGTKLVADIATGSSSGRPTRMTAAGGKLYFRAADRSIFAGTGFELWSSGGTRATTKLVRDIYPGMTGIRANSSDPDHLTAMGGRVLFTADDGKTGTELWTSDGSTANTKLVADVHAGAASSYIQDLVVPSLGARFAWFVADDGKTGKEVWRYDPAKPTGPLTLHDLNPGPLSSYSTYMTMNWRPFSSPMFELSGGTLYFRARRDRGVGTNLEGAELWGIRLGASAKRIGYGCGQYFPTLSSTDPVLGRTMTVSGTRAGPNKVVVLLGALELGAVTTPGRIGTTGCMVYVNAASPVLLTFVTASNASGAWSIPIGIPNLPKLDRQRVRGQALVLPTSAALGFDLSDALDIVIGT